MEARGAKLRADFAKPGELRDAAIAAGALDPVMLALQLMRDATVLQTTDETTLTPVYLQCVNFPPSLASTHACCGVWALQPKFLAPDDFSKEKAGLYRRFLDHASFDILYDQLYELR